MSSTPFESNSPATQHRSQARASAQAGIALLAQAFNHCGNEKLPHRFTADAQARFAELATELVMLVENGDMEANPSHGFYLKAMAARNDGPLQALIRKASKKTPIRAR